MWLPILRGCWSVQQAPIIVIEELTGHVHNGNDRRRGAIDRARADLRAAQEAGLPQADGHRVVWGTGRTGAA